MKDQSTKKKKYNLPEPIVTEYSKKIKRERKRKLKKYKLKTDYEVASYSIRIPEHIIEYKPINFEDTNYSMMFNFDDNELSIDQIFYDLRDESVYLNHALPIFQYQPFIVEHLITYNVPKKIANLVYKFANPRGHYYGLNQFTYYVIKFIGFKNYEKYGHYIEKEFFWGEFNPKIIRDYPNMQSIYFLCFYDDCKKLAEINYPYSVDPFIDYHLRKEAYLLNIFIDNYNKFKDLMSYYNPPEFYPDYFDTNYIIKTYKALCEYMKETFPLRDNMLFDKIDKGYDDLVKTIRKAAKLLGYVESGGRPSKIKPKSTELRDEYEKYVEEFGKSLIKNYKSYISEMPIFQNRYIYIKKNVSSKIYDEMVDGFWTKHFDRRSLDKLPLVYKQCNTVPKIVQTILSNKYGFSSCKAYKQYLKP